MVAGSRQSRRHSVGAHRGGRAHDGRAGALRGARLDGQGRRTATAARSPLATWWWPTAPTPASAGRSATSATASYPQGMALRGYWSSPRHDEPWIDSWLDMKDKARQLLPGYGWIFPVGDGRINVGVGLLTTSASGRGPTPPRCWRLLPASPPVVGYPARDVPWPGHRRAAADGLVGRPPRRAHPPGRRGRRGMINPFNGEGIAYGYETRPVRRRRPAPGAGRRRTPALLATLRGAPRGRVRPLLPGRPGVRASHQPARRYAGLHGHRDAQPAYGVGAAHHVQHAAARRDRTSRGRLQALVAIAKAKRPHAVDVSA